MEQNKSFSEQAETPTNNKILEGQTAPAVEQLEPKYARGFRLFTIVLALTLANFLIALDITIVATAIPRITDQFHSLDQVGWYGSAFFLTFAAFQASWGKAYKYFPLKGGFLVAIGIFEIGSLICAVARNSTTLIVGRAVAGLGGAGVSSGLYTIIAFSAPPQQRPAFTGILGATAGLASVLGPLLGGVLTDRLSWRWCFYINLPIGGLSAAVIFVLFKAPSASAPAKASWTEKLLHMDIPGVGVIIPSVTCFLLAMQWGGVGKPWSHRSVVGTLVGFGLTFVLFLLVEYLQGDRAMLVGRLFKKRVVWASAGFSFFFGGTFYVLLYYIPLYFQVIKNVSAAQSGVRTLPFIISTTLSTIASGLSISATRYFIPNMLLASILITAGCGLLYTLDLKSPSAAWIGYQVLAGIGGGAGFQVPITVCQSVVEMDDISTISAMALFVLVVGGAFMLSAAQAAFANTVVRFLAIYAPTLDAKQVISAGTTEFGATFPAAVVPAILKSYMQGLRVAFALAAAMGGVSLLFVPLIPWGRLATKANASSNREVATDSPV